MKRPVQRWQVLGLLEAEPESAGVLSMAGALLGAAVAERFVPLAVGSGSGAAPGLWEPCEGDEMAVRPYHASQEAMASVSRVLGGQLTGHRALLGLGQVSANAVASQVRTQGAELLVAARGPALGGGVLAEVIAASQIPAVVVNGSLDSGIRKVGVVVEPGEGSVPLMEQALMLAASLGAPLVPVMLALPEGQRRAGGGQEARRFEQMMDQMELPFGAAYATRSTQQPLEVLSGDAVEALNGWVEQAEVQLLVVAGGGPDRSLLALERVAAALVGNCRVALWVEPPPPLS